MEWHGERAKQDIRGMLGAQLVVAAQLLRSRHQVALAKAYPPASRPGEFPRRRTGRLMAGVDFEPRTAEECADTQGIRVFNDTPYERHLLKSGRLGVQDTWAKVRNQVAVMMVQRSGK